MNFSFPDAQNNAKLHAKWMENVCNNAPVGFVVKKGSRLCSAHFDAEMIQKVGQRMMLLPDAIPTIFQNAIKVCVYISFKIVFKCHR